MKKSSRKILSLVLVCVAIALFATGCQNSLGTSFSIGFALSENLVMILVFSVAVIAGYFAAHSFVPWVIFIIGVVVQMISLIGKYRRYSLLGLGSSVESSVITSVIIAVFFLAIMGIVRSRGKLRLIRQVQKAASEPEDERENAAAPVSYDDPGNMFEFYDGEDAPDGEEDGGDHD